MNHAPANLVECCRIVNESNQIWARYAQPERGRYRVNVKTLNGYAMGLALVLAVASAVSVLVPPSAPSSSPSEKARNASMPVTLANQ